MQTTLSTHALNKDYKRTVKCKRLVHADIYKQLPNQLNKAVGLMGNNATVYTKFLQSAGFNSVSLYETSTKVYKKQVRQLKHLPNTTAFNMSVASAPIEPQTFYDIDFTASIKKDYVQDIARIPFKYYALTVSVVRTREMKNSVYTTMDTFLEVKGEKRVGRGQIKLLYNIDKETGERIQPGAKYKRNLGIRCFEFLSDKQAYKLYIYRDTYVMYVITPSL